MLFRTALLLALAGALAAASPAAATPRDERALGGSRAAFVPGELVVQFRAGVDPAAGRAAVSARGARLARRLGADDVALVRIPGHASVRAAAAALERDPRVLVAEPNYLYRLSASPNDPDFPALWGLHQASDADIDAPQAWNRTTGSDKVVVAVVDTGIAFDHPDLAGNMWTHPVNGSHGRDTVDEDNTPLDYHGHGTHVAGTIGAVGNNGLGVTGVSWDVSLMAVRAAGSDGSLRSDDVVQAITYACANGADVVNGSFGGSGKSKVQAKRITSDACRDTLFVFAAGNEGRNLDANSRARNSYPCEFHRPAPHGYSAKNVVCVGATRRNDAISGFSNRGVAAVHLGAPGGGGGAAAGILSTWPQLQTLSGFPESFEDPGFETRWGDEVGKRPTDWGQDTPATDGLVSLGDSPGDAYLPGSSESIRNLVPLDLTGLFGCRADFDLRVDTEAFHDWFDVYALTSTAAPEFPFGLVGSATGTFSGPATVDLTPIDGSATGYLRFSLESDGDANVGDGVQIDELVVSCLDLDGEDYQRAAGTSMATPHVAGVAALLLADKRKLSVARLKNALLRGVDRKAGLRDRFSSGGRLNAKRSLDIVQDRTRPQTTITSRPPNRTSKRRATFRFTSNEARARFQCKHMNGPWRSCSSPKRYSGLSPGTHTFRVRAVDRNLNRDATPATDTWRVRR